MEAVYLVIFSLLTLTSKPTFSLSLRRLPTKPTFVSDVAIFGDAEIINGGSSVQLTRPIASSSGLLIYTKPIKPTSFSTDFSFSISPHSGDGLALVIVPSDFPHNFPGKSSFGVSPEFKFLGIEFDTSMDADVGDENANHVGVDVGSLVSARVFNVSSLNLVLNSGMKLRSWVDYDASSKRLEVRLGEMGNPRPFDPLMGFPIDLSDNVERRRSSCGDKVRSVPNWMHSQPADPRRFSDKGREKRVDHKKDPCPLSLVSGLIVGIGCGALVALMVLFLWAIFVNRHVVIPVGYSWKPADFGYKKVSVDVENSSVNVKN
ncbi:hypothetical protein Acr_24g0011470 [Actinidia rufa]|uniref:Legume lectin domain-containing protein n=1 Tax=Actinidia rufa TaxID=165716 RepID=A0A7J0GVT1_9ERIC|nr:hypothetical protein Acr_24g0011470 [Actinidia rufa]